MKSSRSFPIRQFFLGASVAASLLSAGVANAESYSVRATVSVTESVSPDLTGSCSLIGTISGSGIAVGLGRISTTSTDCITIVDADKGQFKAHSNNFVMTTEAGDTLEATYDVDLQITSLTGVGLLNGTWSCNKFNGYPCGGGGLFKGVEIIRLDEGSGQGGIELSGTINVN